MASASGQTPWFRIGAFFFAIGAGYEYLIIKAGFYEMMRKAAGEKRLEEIRERKMWIKEWEKQGIFVKPRVQESDSREDQECKAD